MSKIIISLNTLNFNRKRAFLMEKHVSTLNYVTFRSLMFRHTLRKTMYNYIKIYISIYIKIIIYYFIYYIRGLYGKYQAILNISRTGHVAYM